MGVGCVRRMQTLSPTPERAGNEMCRLIVMNTASVQLLPTTVAALRAGRSAQTAPFEILPAVWVSSVLLGRGRAAGGSSCWRIAA